MFEVTVPGAEVLMADLLPSPPYDAKFYPSGGLYIKKSQIANQDVVDFIKDIDCKIYAKNVNGWEVIVTFLFDTEEYATMFKMIFV